MSITRLKRRFAGRLGKGILLSLIVVLGIGMVMMFTPSGGQIPGSPQDQSTQLGDDDVMATVNGLPVTRKEFNTTFNIIANQQLQQYGVEVAMLAQLRMMAIQQAQENLLLREEAKAKHIDVSDSEVKTRIDQEISQMVEMIRAYAKAQKNTPVERVFAGDAMQRGGPEQDSMSEREYRDWYYNLLWEQNREAIRQQILQEKLMKAVAPLRPVTDAELQASFDEYTLREIYVTLKPTGKPALTEEQAKKRAEELLAKIRGGADFATLAKTESDNPEAKTNGGLRPAITVSSMQPEWKTAVAPLQQGEVVRAPIYLPNFGYVITKVEKRERKLPPDFEKNKRQLSESAAKQQQQQTWNAYRQGLMIKAKSKVLDPELLGYEALQNNKVDEGLKLLAKAANQDQKLGELGAASVYFQMATYKASLNKWEEAAKYYEQADNYLAYLASKSKGMSPEMRVTTLMGIGRAYQNLAAAYKKQGKEKEAATALSNAVSAYTGASDTSDMPSIHEQLARSFTEMGQTDMAQAEQKKLADLKQQEMERQQREAERQKQMEQQTGKPKRPTGPSPIPPNPAPPTPQKPK